MALTPLPAIECLPFISRDTAREMAFNVDLNKGWWVERGSPGFYTLGAATYQDCPEAYPKLAYAYNSILDNYFERLYCILTSGLQAFFNAACTAYHMNAMPGFHIFDHRTNGTVGHPHIDEPFTRCKWPSEVSDPFTFTVLLEAPKTGAGLDYWPEHTEQQIDDYMQTGELPEPVYLPYEIGNLYIHSGLFPHRIANPGDMTMGERRVSFQGHGVWLPKKSVYWLYF
jgi:hypothetical protein